MPDLYDIILNEHNTLIAGCVGSGKTTLESGLIYRLATTTTPKETVLYLVDPKQFELRHFCRLPHCNMYADTPEGALKVLDAVESLRAARSNWMKNHGLRRWTGNTIYLFIDELADLMTGPRPYVKEFTEKLAKIMQLGRALNIRVIACTQQPRREVTPARIQVNFTANVALHCRSAIESRQVLGTAGAENLPRYGECILSAAGEITRHDVIPVPDDLIDQLVSASQSVRLMA
jgi:S-DNA-T family DNA segregation ATPase FtsK/SpoIIIE